MNQTRNTLRFVLDNRIVEVDFRKSETLKPSTTVLTYLRSLAGHKGVKEGCGEGDCGACTVVVAETGDNGRLLYKAVDSCLLFLPMIHGRQLITVENLARTAGNQQILHPVQKLMVENHGAQCGYCTPGVVMSLFSLYKNHRNPPDEVILNALAGNLCRCTGYKPILESARQACAGPDSDHFCESESTILELLNDINFHRQTLGFHAMGQSWYKPFTLAEALRLRSEHPHAVVTAGSTDVALRQTKKKEFLPEVLDISDVAELNNISEEHGQWILGSGINMEQLRLWSAERIPALFNMLTLFGSLQIRNMATLGGNVGSASPIGDTLPLLFALDARIRTSSTPGERTHHISDFIAGYRKTLLLPEELITGIIIPKPDPHSTIWSYKVSKRKDLDISTVSAGFKLKLSEGVISEVILAYGGMAETPKRAVETETFLTGRPWIRETVELAKDWLSREFTPVSDTRAGAAYRLSVAKNLLMKFYQEHPAG